MYTKRLFNIICILLLSLRPGAQQAAPQLLKEPAEWSFERFNLPPSFAHDFPYIGAEELRFSPGMFNKDSADYFTYAFVAELNGIASMSQEEVRNYLLTYFKGLCAQTAKDRKLDIDSSKITVDVKRNNKTKANEIIYDVLLNIFGVFSDGAPVRLNAEVKVLGNSKTKNFYLLFIASPHQKSDKIWKTLYLIQKTFAMP